MLILSILDQWPRYDLESVSNGKMRWVRMKVDQRRGLCGEQGNFRADWRKLRPESGFRGNAKSRGPARPRAESRKKWGEEGRRGARRGLRSVCMPSFYGGTRRGGAGDHV